MIGVYFISAFILLFLAFIIFRIIVKNDYLKHGKLSFISTMLEFIIFALHANFFYIFIPVKWPNLPSAPDSQVVYIVCSLLFVVGLIIVSTAMLGLGYIGTMGKSRKTLKTNGFYRYSRNPQIIGYGLMIVATVIAYLSWYALGWLVLYVIIAHMMVYTEEEFLLKVFNKEYQEYKERVPRYIRLF
jgi:protein-S-isoprenylcysteine O-methyltransferase Ste14